MTDIFTSDGPQGEFFEPDAKGADIRVFGVGGCGGNVVAYLRRRRLDGVKYIAVNTDAQALAKVADAEAVQIGRVHTRGLGAGANPDIAREAARDDAERLRSLVQGADMVFITAGMGGGTGTGASPVIAQIAREANALTVAVVTRPFGYENRAETAKRGLAELNEHVDSLIVVPNDKLTEVLGDDITIAAAFEASNEVLYNAVAGISEIIYRPGHINVDFADVRTVMTRTGMTVMGSASESGVDRANRAADLAIRCPLQEDVDLSAARGLLINITASPESFKLRELNEAAATIKEKVAADAEVFIGMIYDDAMGDAMRVTVVATGLKMPGAPPALQVVRGGTADPQSPPAARSLPPGMATSGRKDKEIKAILQGCKNEDDIPAILRRQRS